MQSAHRRWALRLVESDGAAGSVEPFGSSGTLNTSSTSTGGAAAPELNAEQQQQHAKQRAWDEAVAPAKGLFMVALMLYMSGSAVSIFSIIITVMYIFQPIKAIMRTNQTFSRFTVDTKLYKLVYVGLQLLGLAMALFKCYSLGLLPSSVDWADGTPPKPAQFSESITI